MTLSIAKSTPNLSDSKALYAALCRKQLETRQVQEEMKTLSSAIGLFTDDWNEFARSLPVVRSRRRDPGQYGFPLRKSDL
jgi:hypothetical protein